MIRPPIENIGCRQPIALKLLAKVLLLAKILRRHFALAFCLSMIFSENRYPLFGIML
jgi:hypothetical protein